MTDTTAPTTFEPDWVGLASACHPALITICGHDTYRSDALQIARLAVESYQRQMDEAGYVVVRREDVGLIADYIGELERDLSWQGKSGHVDEETAQAIERVFGDVLVSLFVEKRQGSVTVTEES